MIGQTERTDGAGTEREAGRGMTANDQDERLREEASAWFARMRGPDAQAHQAAFDAWRADAAHAKAYQRLSDHFEGSAILDQSRLSNLRLAKRQPRDRANAGKVAIALAACLVAAVGLGAVGWRTGYARDHYVTQLGEIRTVALADGARLILDTDSDAAVSKQAGRQVVRLDRGRARIIGAGGDLAVEAGKATISAKGATFDLALAPEAQLDVTVIAGSPTLAPRGGKAELAVLQAGRLTRLGPDLKTRGVQPASGVEASWPSGLRRFDQASLAQVVAIANRYNARKIRFDEPGLGSLKITGVFRVTGSEGLTRALAAAFGLTVETAPGGDLILKRLAT